MSAVIEQMLKSYHVENVYDRYCSLPPLNHCEKC